MPWKCAVVKLESGETVEVVVIGMLSGFVSWRAAASAPRLRRVMFTKN